MDITKKSFSFPKKHDMPLYFVSAADGTNVVRLFRDSIRLANAYRMGDTQDFIEQVLRELEVCLFTRNNLILF
jgi:Rab-like protein 2